jgi:hypothetical protein
MEGKVARALRRRKAHKCENPQEKKSDSPKHAIVLSNKSSVNRNCLTTHGRWG